MQDICLKKNKGYCVICEKEVEFVEEDRWLREHYRCSSCYSLPRQRALIHALNSFVPDWKEKSIHESSPNPCAVSDYFKHKCKKYSCSQFFPDTEYGRNKDGIRCENLESMTFRDSTFDIFITQDVFEHIMNPEKALCEIARVLKPGGVHIFTMPWYPQNHKSIQRAYMQSCEVVHLEEPIYHGNPVDSNGSLVTYDWGLDFAEFIYTHSGMTTLVYLENNRYLGLDAEFLHVFMSFKPSTEETVESNATSIDPAAAVPNTNIKHSSGVAANHSISNIVVIATVKNEADIIESFCRYNLSYSDCMLIREANQSSDSTRRIIQDLIDEGLPIFFEAEENLYYETSKRVLAKIAIEKYNADLVVQLDADEFLYHIDGINPRETLESLDPSVEHRMLWRTYVYEHEPEISAHSIPSNFKYYRNPALEVLQGRGGKTLASRYLLCEKQAQHLYGGHWLEYPEKYKETVNVVISDMLVCAHYPIRSRNQVMNKGIPNFINKWMLPDTERRTRDGLSAFQLGEIFDTIKEHGEITTDTMKDISLKYSLYNALNKDDYGKIDELMNTLGDELLLQGAISTAFCDDKLAMRYAYPDDNEKVFWMAMLRILDDTLQFLDNESRGKNLVIDELKWQRDELERHRDEIEQLHYRMIKEYNDLLRQSEQHYNAMMQQRDELKAQIEHIYASRTWIIGRRIMRVLRFFMPKK